MPPLLWDLQACDERAASALSASMGIDPVTARLLCQRGVTTPDEAARFLNPSLDDLHDPLRLTDMPQAVDRILEAIARRERIVIHGDYDVDGITATVILERAIEGLGGNVGHFIPDRLKDGYGLVESTVERLHADGVRLIVSVDCGIRSVEAARRATALGVDLIVTDHHEPDSELPRVVAVINPKRTDCDYPDKNLAGAGVALKLVQALCTRSGREKWLPGFVKIAAIGTLADVVPLTGENRVIAKLGLDLLSRGPHKVGLQALLDASGLSGKPIDSYHVSFILAPRVNAAGRMATPDIAARLLLAADDSMAEEARALATQLNDENLRRQEQEQEILAAARRVVDTDPDVGAHAGTGGVGRGLAPRRHRDRGVQTGGRLRAAGDRRLGRGRRRSRILPQHSGIRHAGGSRGLQPPPGEVRRPSHGGRPHAGGRVLQAVSLGDPGLRGRAARSRRPPPEASRGCASGAGRDQGAAGRGDHGAGAVRPRQSPAGVLCGAG